MSLVEDLEHCRALRHRGKGHFTAGRLQEAAAEYSAALHVLQNAQVSAAVAASPDVRGELAAAASNRAACHLGHSRYEEAIADCCVALEAQPDYVKALYRRARAHLGQGDEEAARNDLKSVLLLEPGNLAARSLLSRIKEPTPPRAADPVSLAALAKSQITSGPPPNSLFPPPLQQGYLFVEPPLTDPSQSRGDKPQRQQATNLLLLLHGVGDTPKPYASFAMSLKLPFTASLALAGPLEVPETDGGRAWFDIFDENWELIQPKKGEVRRIRSLKEACSLMCRLIDALHAHAWQYRNIHILGFSNGGTVALELARYYTGVKQLGGIVAVSSSLLPETLAEEVETSLKSPPTRVLITHGEHDRVVMYQDTEKTADFFRHSHPNARVDLFRCNKAHAMPNDKAEMDALMAFWSETLKSPAPPGVDGEGGDVFEVGLEGVGGQTATETRLQERN